jgi:mannose-1-phosphate guanylyltransferase
MKAILLSAGLGNRLRPLTEKIPKCLVPINGKPILQIWLERLSAENIGPFLINTHYLPNQVNDFVSSSVFSSQISLVNEDSLLGTAGTLIKNIDFFNQKDGLLIHADNYCLADLKEFIIAHEKRPKKCLMTMMTFQTSTPSTCGIVEIDSDKVVIGFHEKVNNPPGNLANGAIYILSNELLKTLKNEMSRISDFSLDLLPKLIGKIFTYETSELFIDIGTNESYKKANRL